MAAEMIFHDADGRVMSRDEVIAAGMGHLLDDAPVYRCTRCNRRTTSLSKNGPACLMRQPGGMLCGGHFVLSAG